MVQAFNTYADQQKEIYEDWIAEQESGFEEWSEEVSERTDTGYKDQKIKSAKEREKRIREMDEIIKKDLKE